MRVRIMRRLRFHFDDGGVTYGFGDGFYELRLVFLLSLLLKE
jgi:hypothetical protein